jgi:CopA family copper-resistance protein
MIENRMAYRVDRNKRGATRRMTRLVLALLASTIGGTGWAGEYDLVIAKTPINITGKARTAVTINGALPGTALRWREGEEVILHVANRLDEPTSIHWHGIILPNIMDGVPGMSFHGIPPGETFTYRFPVRQSGTYWYHSHSAFQEQSGMYAPIVIEPARAEPYGYDRDHVVLFSDWTDENPRRVYAHLKAQSGYYNFQKRTVFDFFRDVGAMGWRAALADRLAWGEMRMDPTDIADVTAYTYTYLVNGKSPEANWTGLFKPGERVRLRFINASAMTYLDVRIPGLKMTVVQADGQDIQPVTVDELRMAVAETYDVIVEPKEASAYTLFAETMDRGGYARGTLAPRPGMEAPIPARRSRPLLTMTDMGMDHSVMNHAMAAPGPHEAMMEQEAMADHGAMGHASPSATEDDDGMSALVHGPDRHGPGNAMVAMVAKSRLHEPGIGLVDTPEHKILLYSDLRAREPAHDRRKPEREIELHLTGNMERYMWSFDGKKFSEAEPIRLRYGERVRFTLVNDTMMNHPLHLHGMWSELVNGAGASNPRKHVINAKPAERISFDVTADAPGEWPFHCHLLYHMDAGMFRKIIVTGEDGTEPGAGEADPHASGGHQAGSARHAHSHP